MQPPGPGFTRPRICSGTSGGDTLACLTVAMDFFQHQEQARRKSGMLVVLFLLAVLATVTAVNLAVVPIVAQGGEEAIPATVAVVTLCVLATITVGSLIKMAQMAGGGAAVADALGARRIQPDSGDPVERRALNVVEEMAIASGMPVPPVYVLEDETINAFAAGRTPQDSVIGLTRGCMEKLTRDELQGVVAHEFSHIFHQDTRLNMRLVGLLGGIMAISLVGQGILRSMRYHRVSRSSRGKDGAAGILLIGLALFVVGLVGYFFARLIQTAVCRQREYLADASAVQYTRNPEGLANALARIVRAGSRIEAPRAAEFSHFMFANGLESLFATHPPAEERIRRILALTPGAPLPEPRGEFPFTNVQASGSASASTPAAAVAPVAGAPSVPPRAVPPLMSGLIPGQSVRHAAHTVGEISPEQLQLAAHLLASLPPAVMRAAREPFAARAVVLGLLLSPEPRTRAAQMEHVRVTDARLHWALSELQPHLQGIRPGMRLPLLELSAASLAALSSHQYTQFRQIIEGVSMVDGQVDRFEWIVRVVLRSVVERRGLGDRRAPRPGVRDEALVTSVLAYSGSRTPEQARHAWEAARTVNPVLPAELLPIDVCTLDAVDASLRSLDRSTPAAKHRLVDGCVAAVCADGTTTAVEAELLCAICAAISVPMPPVRAEP